MYDHELPRETLTRLDRIADLLGEIRDRLPQPLTLELDVSLPDAAGAGAVELREPDPPTPRKSTGRRSSK